MKKKIFITGGSGFIGREVVRLLADKNKYQITSLVRTPVQKPENNVEYVIGDILDINSFRKYAEQADIILHMAALITGSNNIIERTNIDGTKNLVEISKNKYFVFVSSENTLHENQGVYGESKKKAEEIIKENLNNFIILRPSVVYGKYNKKNLGLIINICQKRHFILIPGNGKKLMQPIFVEDVAQFILNAIEKNKKGEFTLAGATKLSTDEFIDKIANILNKKIVKIHIPLVIIYPFIKINEYLLKNPFIRWSQIKNLNSNNRFYNIDRTIKELNYTPIEIDEGLLKILK